MQKICQGCKKEKGIDEFNYKNKEKAVYQSQCKQCTRQQVRKHYYNNHEYYLRKAGERNKLVRKKVKKFIWDYLQKHPCVDCGERDAIVLTFDHVKGKLFNVSDTTRWRFGLTRLKEEIKKCEIRCANCHLRRTSKQFGWKKMVS